MEININIPLLHKWCRECDTGALDDKTPCQCGRIPKENDHLWGYYQYLNYPNGHVLVTMECDEI